MRNRILPAIVSVLTVIVLSTPAPARPPANTVEPPGVAAREFVPRAGYARTAKALYLDRLASGGRNEARASYDALEGNRNIPTILLSFRNRPAPFPAASYQDALFEDVAQRPIVPRRTLTAYYRDVSHGKLLVGGRVVGWYPLPKDDTYYENNTGGVVRNGDGPEFGEMLQYGLEKADAEIDFGLYDNDGPDGLPNSGDDDGKVDTVFFIHPEAGAECRGAAARNIWSHSWHYSEPSYGHSGPFVTRAIRLKKDGTPVLNDDQTPQHIVVEDYTIQPGVDCPGEANDPVTIVPIGVFCHEFGHALGLPDLYDRTGHSAGIGNWCLMAGGSYGGDGRSAHLPASMSAWCKSYLGWAAPETLEFDGKFFLEPAVDRGRIYRINVPGTARREYFLFEYRDKAWEDRVFGVRQNWDRTLPATGVAVWHVDERVGEGAAWPFAPKGFGQNDAPSIPGGQGHAMVCLCQKDRNLDLEFNRNRGDCSDLLGHKDQFGDDQQFRFGSRGYDQQPSNIAITDVDLEARNLTVKLGGTALAAGPARNPAAAAPPRDEQPDAAAPARQAAASRQPVSDRKMDDRLRLGEAVKKLQVGQPLSRSDDRVLAEADDRDVEQVAPPAALPKARAASASARTRVVSPVSASAGAAAGNPPDERIAALLRQQAPGGELTVRFSPDHDRVEYISGLALPAQTATVEANGKLRAEGNLKALLGEKVDFAAKPKAVGATTAPSTSPATRAERFWQTTPVGGTDLPVFGTETALFYKQDKVTTVQSTTVPPDDLKVSGRAGVLSIDEAKKAVASQLGFSQKMLDTIKECREGVFLPDDDPARARVAYRVCVPSGKGHEPIHVYLDPQTKQIIKVK